MTTDAETIGIVGCGGMGRGIAEAAALCGLHAVLVKATPGAPDAARKSIDGSFDRAVQKGKLAQAARDAAGARIRYSDKLEDLGSCSLIIESIVEELPAKRDLFTRLDAMLPPAAVLATNTSSLPLKHVATVVKNKVRFLGLHFFSPVPLMKLVELAAIDETEPRCVEVARAVVERMGKTPVIVGDTSGYLVNRLLVPYLLHAISTLQERLAPAQSIDAAMKLGCAHPMGPLALADAIGLDVVMAMADTMERELGDPRYRVPALLRALNRVGALGKKSKLGLYDYSVDPPAQNDALWHMVAKK